MAGGVSFLWHTGSKLLSDDGWLAARRQAELEAMISAVPFLFHSCSRDEKTLQTRSINEQPAFLSLRGRAAVSLAHSIL